MTAVLANQPANTVETLRELWRRAVRRLRRGPIVRWRFIGPSPDRILIAPPDLRTADAHLALEMLHGRFILSGKTLNSGNQSPFTADPPSPLWEADLHGFRWLRHIREEGGPDSEQLARKLVGDWISLYGNAYQGIAWDADVTARRVIAWLQHSTLLLRTADLSFYEGVLKSIATQVRYLRTMTAGMEAGETLLRCRIALAFAALSLPVSQSRLHAATRNLERELKAQVLPDGVHISRNPETVLELLTDLLPLRQTYASQSESPPQGLVAAIERLMPALRFFRHRDGALANFNGAGYAMQERMAAVLRYDDSGGSPLSAAPHGGYQRLADGGVTVIADTGALPPRGADANVHAGCLSFELSSGRHRYIVNGGTDWLSPADYRMLARATAAHSTATLNDTSSIRFMPEPAGAAPGNPAVLSGPRKVIVSQQASREHPAFTASHDAYVRRFGIVHSRSIAMTHGGSVIAGTDSFAGPDNYPTRHTDRDLVTLRFHLNPQVRLEMGDNNQIVLTVDRDDTWVFTCEEVAAVSAESLFFAGITGPQKTRMIVLEFHASEVPVVHWQLTRTALGEWSH